MSCRGDQSDDKSSVCRSRRSWIEVDAASIRGYRPVTGSPLRFRSRQRTPVLLRLRCAPTAVSRILVNQRERSRTPLNRFNISKSRFLNLGSEVQVLSGTPISAQFMIDRNAREWTPVQPGDATTLWKAGRGKRLSRVYKVVTSAEGANPALIRSESRIGDFEAERCATLGGSAPLFRDKLHRSRPFVALGSSPLGCSQFPPPGHPGRSRSRPTVRSTPR
jgi:hypothetical protein